MLEIDIRLSHRIVSTIAGIERFCGAWPRLSQNTLLTSEERRAAALQRALLALAELDENTAPQALIDAQAVLRGIENPVSADQLEFALRHNPEFNNLCRAFRATTDLSPEGFQHLHAIVESGAQRRSCYRNLSSKFRAPSRELIFPTTSAFLIESRLEELFRWSQRNVRSGDMHPLLVLGVQHLLLLQLSPFDHYSHTVVLLHLRKSLIACGYSFVSFADPVEVFRREHESYFSALRQAEKTAGASWATLTVWLEFFLDAIEESCESLLQESEHVDRSSRLSSVQQNILAVVKEHGRASRELIVHHTGINTSTVKYNLSLLAAHGLLKRQGGGRSTSYSIL